MATDRTEALMNAAEIDKELKKQLVLDVVSKQCIESSIPELLDIANALSQTKHKLEIKTLSGGFTNYSYKLYVNSDPSKALFAKIAFPYALWSGDKNKYYDTIRTVNEFKMMQDLDRLIPGYVPKPYLCLDVGEDCKLLVTEWSKADEQFSNQMIDGTIDTRIPPKIGEVLAKLHLADFDPNYNDAAARSSCIADFFDGFTEKIDVIRNDESSSNTRAARLASEVGKITFSSWVKELKRRYMEDRECLIHSDSHAFNILVEAKPDPDLFSSAFGPHGNFALIDFEMSTAGPRGRDVGVFNAFPLVCAIAHALNGHPDASANLMRAIDAVWESYYETITAGGADEDSVRRTYRDTIAWTGFFMLLAHGQVGLHNDFLPPFESEDDLAAIVESARVLGLTLMRLGMSPSSDDRNDDAAAYEALRDTVRAAVWTEIGLRGRCDGRIARRRRSSLLRTSGRRVSDTAIYLAAIEEALETFPADLVDEEVE